VGFQVYKLQRNDWRQNHGSFRQTATELAPTADIDEHLRAADDKVVKRVSWGLKDITVNLLKNENEQSG
jgi:hypothetical protein